MRGGTLGFLAGVSNVTQEPLHVAFNTPCSAAIYYPSYCVICVQQRPAKNPILYKISATLHGTNIACFNSL